MDQGLGRRRLAPVLKLVESCNLACSYCYQGTPETTSRRMSEEVLERILSELARVTSSVQLLWYGGEPTLVGLPRFREILAQAARHIPPDRLRHAIQTNATLIDEEWARLLAEHDFTVTISLDGPPELHDAARRNRRGEGSQQAVTSALRAMQAEGVHPRASCVVHHATLPFPERLLDYFVEVGLREVDFPPAIRYREGGFELLVEPREYGRFMVRILEHWLALGRRDLRIRGLAGLARALAGQHPGFCRLEGNCSQYVTFAASGDVYPCDEFSGIEGHRLGHVMERPLDEILSDPRVRDMHRRWSQVPSACGHCEWLDLCRGGCPFERMTAGGPDRRSALCEGLRLLYDRMAGEIPPELRKRGTLRAQPVGPA